MNNSTASDSKKQKQQNIAWEWNKTAAGKDTFFRLLHSLEILLNSLPIPAVKSLRSLAEAFIVQVPTQAVLHSDRRGRHDSRDK